MVSVGLAGEGEARQRRLSMLRQSGVEPVPVASDAVSFDGLSVLYVAGLEPLAAGELARRARAARVLVNVEDRPELCDFHVPAIVRRGDLAFTVSTSGRAPGLARRLRE
jgi:precorrin-2 dehydrogenase/sirohydrochlorin ferrochelatase